MEPIDRIHPDLFNAREAAVYLHLDSQRTLETLRKNFGLMGFGGANKSLMYRRSDLDECALRMVGGEKSLAPIQRIERRQLKKR